jgi:hypothetical protein
MGYCYEGKKLCCDICGKAGARKMKCPFGYCPAPAACPECRKTHAARFTKAAHVKMGCDAKHNAYMADLKSVADLKAAGKFVRCSALGVDSSKKLYENSEAVHVLFSNSDSTIGYYMTADTYHAIKLYAATPEDYEKIGPLMPAPSDFHHGV